MIRESECRRSAALYARYARIGCRLSVLDLPDQGIRDMREPSRSARVAGMSEEQMESGEITERFRAFAQSVDPEPSNRTLSPIVIAVITGVLVLAGIGLLLFRH